jgi:hypothetical protein
LVVVGLSLQGNPVATVEFDRLGNFIPRDHPSLLHLAEQAIKEWPSTAREQAYPRLYELALETMSRNGDFKKDQAYVEMAVDLLIPKMNLPGVEGEWIDEIRWGVLVDCEVSQQPTLAKRYEDKIVLGYKTMVGPVRQQMTVVMSEDGVIHGEYIEDRSLL